MWGSPSRLTMHFHCVATPPGIPYPHGLYNTLPARYTILLSLLQQTTKSTKHFFELPTNFQELNPLTYTSCLPSLQRFGPASQA
jgi:hypothetical protein